jgi:multiple sugar transport system substrate-binding protein
VADDLGINAVWNEYTAAVTKQVTSALAKEKPIGEALKAAQADAQAAVDRFRPAN